MKKNYYYNALWTNLGEGKRKSKIIPDSPDVIQHIINVTNYDSANLEWEEVKVTYHGFNYKIFKLRNRLMAFDIFGKGDSTYFVSSNVDLHNDLSFEKGVEYVLEGVSAVYKKYIDNN